MIPQRNSVRPDWRRGRPPPPPKDQSALWILLVIAAILFASAYAVRKQTATRQAAIAAQEAAKATYLEAQRQSRARLAADSLSRQRAAAAASAAQSSWSGATVFAPPGVQIRESSRDEQYRNQMRAEARLRAEQERFAALTAQDNQLWRGAAAPTPVPDTRFRCERAKAARDEAYRTVGNNRTFDFIRRWDDFVYQECKQR